MPLIALFIILFGAVTYTGAAVVTSVVPALGDVHGGVPLTVRVAGVNVISGGKPDAE